MKPYEMIYYKGLLREIISNPTPNNTIMIRIKDDPTTMIEVLLEDIQYPFDYLTAIVCDYSPAELSKLIERVGIDHDASTALLLVNNCLKKGLNLSHCWNHIRFYIHDILRRGNPEWDREQIYTDTIEQLCDSVALFARYMNETVSTSEDGGMLSGSGSTDRDIHSDLREEGRDGEEDELPKGCSNQGS